MSDLSKKLLKIKNRPFFVEHTDQETLARTVIVNKEDKRWLINKIEELEAALDKIDEIAFQNGYEKITAITVKIFDEQKEHGE